MFKSRGAAGGLGTLLDIAPRPRRQRQRRTRYGGEGPTPIRRGTVVRSGAAARARGQVFAPTSRRTSRPWAGTSTRCRGES